MVTSAALDARDDLDAAAVSMERLGQLTSGMWRALSHELAEAAERLDRQVDEHLDEVSRRAKALEVAPEAVLAAGVAAGHLAEHREALEALLPNLEEEVRRLAASDVLLGFSVEDDVLVEDDAVDEDDLEATGEDGTDSEPGADTPVPAVDVWLFLWPAPFNPARVRVTPDPELARSDAPPDIASVGVGAVADDVALEALSALPGVQRGDVLPALAALGLACWSAHLADEHVEEDEADSDEDDVF